MEHLADLGDRELRDKLKAAGLKRFQERVSELSIIIERNGADQALYAAIFEVLGYAENREPFAELARRLPVVLLRSAALAWPEQKRSSLVSDLLLAGSGLTPVSRAWSDLMGTPPMRADVWRTAGVRPANRPQRRLAAAAWYASTAITTGLAAPLARASIDGITPLVQALTVRGETGTATLVGDARAREIAINAVLPTLVAIATLDEDQAGAAGHQALYERFPSLPSNTITREATRLLGPRVGLRLGACEQQGLIHLYRQAISA